MITDGTIPFLNNRIKKVQTMTLVRALANIFYNTVGVIHPIHHNRRKTHLQTVTSFEASSGKEKREENTANYILK